MRTEFRFSRIKSIKDSIYVYVRRALWINCTDNQKTGAQTADIRKSSKW